MKSLTKYRLEVIVFTAGAITMIVEMVGSRVIAPFFGSSTYTWTGLIGVILASLSAGYYYGGKLADKQPNFSGLSKFLLISSFLVIVTNIFKDMLLSSLPQRLEDIRIFSLVGSFILFAPVSFFMGMVSPYAVKLRLKKIEASGSTVGNLYALSTLGSIFGTFLAGFYLISFFGTTNILSIIAISLLILSFYASPRYRLGWKAVIAVIFILSLLWLKGVKNVKLASGVYDIDTEYSRIIIGDTLEAKTGRKIRYFIQSKASSSAMYIDSNDLVFEYSKYYDLAQYFNPGFRKTLLLGGAAYSYPKYFLHKYPQSTMDVVEIDPKVTELAKMHFNLKDDPRLNIYHEDARVYLNNNTEKYDVIYGDAFNALYSIPSHLTTAEAVERIYNSLSDNGVTLVNTISALQGQKSYFLQAEYNTYKRFFPHVYIFTASSSNPYDTQNIILVASKAPQEFTLKSQEVDTQKLLDKKYPGNITSDLPILTDDFSPVEYYVRKMM